jgi:hypothetical protein
MELMSYELDGAEVRHHLSSTAINVRAFQVLRNMVRRLRCSGVQVRAILVSDARGVGPTTDDVPWPSEDNEASVYPSMRSALEQLVVREDADFAKSRRCLLELTRELEAHEVENFEGWVAPWFRLLEAGGYAMPIGFPEDTESIAGTVTQVDPRTVEIAVPRFFASEMAWNAVVNMANAIWRTSNPIRRIVID